MPAARPFTRALRFGSAVDRLVFGVGDEIVIKTKRGEKEQAGTILIKQEDLDRAQAVRLAVTTAVPRLASPVLAAKGEILHQAKYVWNNGVECSAKPDQVDLAMEAVNDLKTARDLSDAGIMFAIEEYGYHIQMAAYEEAVRVKYGWPAPLMRLVFVETQAPYDVRVVRMESPRSSGSGTTARNCGSQQSRPGKNVSKLIPGLGGAKWK